MHVGRPKASAVWNYYVYDPTRDVSVCQVKLAVAHGEGPVSSEGSSQYCSTALRGKFPTNLKHHLKNRHPTEFVEMQQEESRVKLAKGKSKTPPLQGGQITLGQSFEWSRTYDKGNVPYCLIMQKLAVFVHSTNVPNRIVEIPEFRELLNAADPCYSVLY